MESQQTVQTQTGISDSRFYMWRAVFAMAHADGKVTKEEMEFAENYFEHVPFSAAQIAALRADLKTPCGVNEMLIGVSSKEDMADFFQFAQMMVWSDGDYDRQEQIIIERLTAEQMNKFNKEELAQQIREARAAAAIRRGIEDDEFRKQAKETGVLATISRSIKDKEYRDHVTQIMRMTAQDLFATYREKGTDGFLAGELVELDHITPDGKDLHAVMDWMRMEVFTAPDEEVFNIWRAVFALAHADGNVGEEEYEYIRAMMALFHFSDEQKNLIELDVQSRPDIGALFDQIQGKEQRSRYFVMARTIIWCDGVFHERERAVMEDIKTRLGAGLDDFKAELEWIEKKPEIPGAVDSKSKEEKVLRGVLRQMLDFYQERTA